MRKAAEFAGLVVLMVGARYAPLDRIGALVSSKAPATPVVTGSVSKASEAPLAQTGGARTAKSIEDKVQTILAQASEIPRSNGRSNGQSGGGDRARIKTDESAADEIFTGGTGLVDVEVEEDNAPARALAQANPNDFLVICEAGCRPSNDRIVYRVSKMAAAASAIAERRLEVTAAQPKQPDEGENAGVVCVAGCYDDEPPQKHAQQSEKTARKLAQVDEPAAAVRPVAHDDAKPATIEPVTPARAEARQASAQQETKIASEASVTPASDARAAEPAAAAASQSAPSQQTAHTRREDDLTSAHLISAETAAHLAAKRSKLATTALPARPPVRVSRWRTKVTSIVALQPSAPPRSVVALAPFDTSVSVEGGWESSLLNTQ